MLSSLIIIIFTIVVLVWLCSIPSSSEHNQCLRKSASCFGTPSYSEKIPFIDHFSSVPPVLSCISSTEGTGSIGFDSLLDSVWKLIEDSYEKFACSYPSLVFNKDNKQIFEELYKEECANSFPLDSYKQTAIITICCLKANLVEHSPDNDKISIIPQLIAVHVGLSCMLEYLNSLSDVGRTVQHYYFPVPFTDDSCYAENICLLLYHEQQTNHFSVGWLASRYVLLESLNLSQHGINSTQVKQRTEYTAF